MGVTWIHPRFAVIPTLGRACFEESLEAIRPQVDAVVIIHAPQEHQDTLSVEGGHVYYVSPDEKRNISRWWNLGITYAKTWVKYSSIRITNWDIAILNDDAIVPSDWFDQVGGRMRQMKVAAASMGTVAMPVLHTRPGTTPVYQRMSGHAFVLAGELGVRADESLEWWFGDNDIDMQSRLKGGTVVIPGQVKHLHPNGTTTGELAAQTAVDAQRFVDKWGFPAHIL